MDDCVRLFCVCVVLCVGSAIAEGWSPVQGVLPTVCRIKKLKKRPKSNKRTVELQIDRELSRAHKSGLQFQELKRYPCNRTWRPIGLWYVEAPTFSRQSAGRWRRRSQPYAPVVLYLQEDSWYPFLLEFKSNSGTYSCSKD
jgi:hypothetical protein